MKSIYTAFRRLLSSSFLLPIVFLFQCDDSDDGKENVVCTKDLRILKVLPNRNPIAAPILIIGKSFSNSTKATFNEIESEITVVNDSTITTSAPFKLKETIGLIELSVIDGNCSFTTGFTLIRTFEDVYRISPPTIFFPDPSKKVIIDIQDKIATHGNYFLRNLWGDKHALSFEAPDNEGGFVGREELGLTGGISNSLWCRINGQDGSIEVKTYYNQNYVPYPGDHLVGGFYEMTLLTTTGPLSNTFLFLQSTLSGRQYVFH